MILFIILLVCFLATLTGAICGMGGGIIIKPVLDSLGVYDAATISFLSSCTVLCMSAYSVAEVNITKSSQIDRRTGTTLAFTAAVGGIIGKELFMQVAKSASNLDSVRHIQACFMLLLTVACLIYSLLKSKRKSVNITSMFITALVGLFLGTLSSFLGIGGGPVNVSVLFLLFSMSAKVAAQNSLYIVLFCQLFGILWTIIKGNVPTFPVYLLILMGITGIIGGICGRLINKKITNTTVEKLFRVLMIIIIAFNINNLFN